MKKAQHILKKLSLSLVISFIFVSYTHAMQWAFFQFYPAKRFKKLKTAELKDGTFVDAQYIQIIDDIFKEQNDSYAALFNEIRKKCINNSYNMHPEAEILSRAHKLHPIEDEDTCKIIKILFIDIRINEKKAAIINYPFKKNQNKS